jgi:hypothetical protein
MKDIKISLHFDFKYYKECFKEWRYIYRIYGDKVKFVISTHELTSGYWIENSDYDVLDNGTEIVYKGKEVDKLIKRVLYGIKKGKKELIV